MEKTQFKLVAIGLSKEKLVVHFPAVVTATEDDYDKAENLVQSMAEEKGMEVYLIGDESKDPTIKALDYAIDWDEVARVEV